MPLGDRGDPWREVDVSRASGGWTHRTQDRAISTVVFRMWLQLSLGAHTGNCIKALQASDLLGQEMVAELASGISDASLGFQPSALCTFH